jgi:hypothetical protein
LNSLLQSIPGIEGAAVIDVRQERLSGPKNFNANLYRLFLTFDRPAPAAPQRLIAKLPTSSTELNERAAVFQPGSRENWFYRFGATRSPINVPRCYYNGIDAATGQSILLLEDLAPAPSGNQLAGATLPEARLALESLSRLHARWWEKADSVEIQELTHLLKDTWSYEQNLVQQLYDTAWPRFLLQSPDLVPDEVRQFGAAIVGNMRAVDVLLDHAPKTLAHGDYRLENIHFGLRQGKAACWVIDWEDVFFGSGMVDVSWFLGGCLPEAQSGHEVELLQIYYLALIDEGVAAYSWDQCYDEYRRAMCGNFVQGVLSATLNEGATDYDRSLARVIGERFIAAVQRLRLPELMQSSARIHSHPKR